MAFDGMTDFKRVLRNVEGDRSVEISIHQPTEFVRNNQGDFLPDWNQGVESVIIVLQQASLRLIGDSDSTQKEKDFLFSRLVDFGRGLTEKLEPQGYLTDMMNPITGKAMFSTPGKGCHDDIRVVSELLGIRHYDCGGCRVLVHERWREAVYPGVLMSSAKRDLIESVIEEKVCGGASDSAPYGGLVPMMIM